VLTTFLDLVNVVFSGLVSLNCAAAELLSIVSLETPNNSHIQWLDKQSHIGLKWQEANVLQFILDIVAQEIVNCETDMLILVVHFNIKILNIPVGKTDQRLCTFC
jgi:hypothetical protein